MRPPVSARRPEPGRVGAHIDLGLQAVLQGRNKLVASRCRGPSSAGKVVFGSDHGLCGRFNEMIAEHALREGDGRSGADRWLAAGERVAAAPVRETEGGLQIPPVPASAAAITSLVQRVLLQVNGRRQR